MPGVEHLTMCKSQFHFIIILPDFMKDIIAGKKKYLKQAKVTQCYVPQYEGLGLREIYAHIDNDPALQAYFPSDTKERARLPK